MFKLNINFTFSLLIFNAVSAFSQQFNSEVIKLLTTVEIKNDRMIKTDSMIIQINNRSGESHTVINIPYTKNQKISDITGWIEDEDGNIVRKLKGGDIEERSNISDYSLYEDDFVKTFQLKHNIYPYRIFCTYKITTRDFITIAWSPVKSAQYSTIPTLYAKLTMILPKGFPVKNYTRQFLRFKTDTLENTIRSIWESDYVKPITKEVYSDSKASDRPYVMVTPIHFVYGVEGSCENWETFGNWVYRLIRDLDVLPQVEKERVAQLTSGVKDKRQIVKILYHYLQDHTRYINVTMDIGGLKPYPASYVALNKYGDCKALSNYMKALLKQAGINSYYTIVYRGDDPYEVQKDFPGPQYFNHVILTVPLDKDTLWLENTNNIGPFESISPDIQDREALLVDEYHSRIIRIPALNKKNVAESWTVDITMNEAANAEVEMKATFRGDDFDYFNQLKSDLNKNEQDEIIHRMIRISNFDLLSWALNKPDRDSATINLSLKLSLYKVLKSLGDEKYFSTFGIGVPIFPKPNERTTPVKIKCPVYNVDTIVYHLPLGYEIKSIPERIQISSAYGNYNCLVESFDSGIRVIKEFELFTGTYTLDEYPDFYKFISAVNEKENTKLLIKKKM